MQTLPTKEVETTVQEVYLWRQTAAAVTTLEWPSYIDDRVFFSPLGLLSYRSTICDSHSESWILEQAPGPKTRIKTG